MKTVVNYLHDFSRIYKQTFKQTAALNSATHHAMPPDFSERWGTELS